MESDRREFTFRSEVAGVDVFVQSVSCSREDAGTVLILHGLGDHLVRHEWAVFLFCGLGYNVIGLEWPGNGRSGGKRGDMPATDSIGPLLDEVLNRESIKPVGVFAHSTGGFYLIHTYHRQIASLGDLRWVWLSSPLLHPEEGQSPLKISIAKRLAKRFPGLTLRTGVHPSDCYEVGPGEDPAHFHGLSHNRVTLRAGLDLMLAGRRLEDPEVTGALSLPVLVTEGSEDEVCPPHLTEAFFRRLPEGEKTMVYVSKTRHEPFHEQYRAPILNAARAWLSFQKSRL